MVSIAEEHRRLREAGLEFITRARWGSRFDYTNARTVVEPAKQVFVHISVTNASAYNSHAAHVRGIEAIGIARFPNTGISYNRVILFGVDKPYLGQPISRRGAHTVNDHRRSTCTRFVNQCPGYKDDLTAPSWNLNYTARAYVYGALCGHAFTDSVLDTMARTIAADKRAGLVDRDAKIHGHRCVSSKSCPCDQIWARMHELEQRVNDYLEDRVSYNEVWRTDDKMDNPRLADHPDTKNKHWWPETVLERIGRVLLVRKFRSPYLRDNVKEAASLRWLLEWAWHYAHGARTNAAEAKAAAKTNGKQIAELAAQVSGLTSAVEQLSGGAVDMAAVQAAAQAGAEDALRDVQVTVTFDEPDSDAEPDDDPDA